MLQLNKSQTTNTIAFYPNELTTGSLVYFSGSQDYDKSTSSFAATIISNPLTTPWIVAQVSGSLLPSASGQYTYDVYDLNIGGALVWNLANTNWNEELTVWNDTSSISVGDLISNERAFISGSDVVPVTEYVSPDENGAYITYLG